MPQFNALYLQELVLAAARIVEGGTFTILSEANVELAIFDIPDNIIINDPQNPLVAGLREPLTTTILEAGIASSYILRTSTGGEETGTVSVFGEGGDLELAIVDLRRNDTLKLHTLNCTLPI